MKKVLSILFLNLFIFCSFAFADPEIFDSFNSSRRVVATAGERVQLSTENIRTKRTVITAETDNTGMIVVGGSNVVAALATREGIPLSSGDTMTVKANNLNEIYLDSTIDGEGVTFVYYN